MRIKTVGLVIAGAAVVAGAAGGVAWASNGTGADAEPSVRIVQQEQPAPEQPAPAPDRDCPEKNGQPPAASPSESL